MPGRPGDVKEGDLPGTRWLGPPAGVRGSIVAGKRGNARGAKGPRKVDAERKDLRK